MAKSEPTKLRATTATVNILPQKAPQLAGKYISLNMKRRQFFGVANLELTPDKPTLKISRNIPDNDLYIIQSAIDRGELIISKNHIPYVTKNANILQFYIDKLAHARSVKKDLHQWVVKLVTGKELGGYTIHDILNAMLGYELKNACRDAFIDYLQYAMDKIPGHTSARDYQVTEKKKIDTLIETQNETEETKSVALDKI